jgi:hypothetical protein
MALLVGGAAKQDIVTFAALALPAVAFLTSILYVINDKKDNKMKAYLLSQSYGILNMVAVLSLQFISNRSYPEIGESVWEFSLWFSATVIFLNLFLNIAIVTLSRD